MYNAEYVPQLSSNWEIDFTLRDIVDCVLYYKFPVLFNEMKLALGVLPKYLRSSPEVQQSLTSNKTTEFLLGTDRWKFALSVLVEAEIPRGGGVQKISARNQNFQVIFYWRHPLESVP